MKTILKRWIGRANLLGTSHHLQGIKQASKNGVALQKLPTIDVGYLPWSSFALSPLAVSALLNEVVLNGGSRVIECGIGISTLHLLNPNLGYQPLVFGIDDNAEWIQTIQTILEKMGVSKNQYRLVHAPIVNQSDVFSTQNQACQWYDDAAINGAIQDFFGPRPDADMLIVDGPKGSLGKLARYPALPRLRKYLGDDFSVFLDDTDRADENEISQLWVTEFDLDIRSEAVHDDICILRPKNTKKTKVVV